MKKILLALVIPLFCISCGSYLSITTSSVDLRPFAQKGFYITPSMTLEKPYTPVGEVSVTISNYMDGWHSAYNSEMAKVIGADARVWDMTDYFQISREDLGVPEYAVCKLVSKAVDLGGNAIINFRIVENKGENGLGYIYVSGCAINYAK